MLSASGLTRRFGTRTAVDSVSFDVARGEIVALLGPNGAGKTTTLRMLAGLIAPTAGSVTIDGVVLTRATGSALRHHVGFLTESPGLWDRLTVRENLAVYARLYALAAPGRVVDEAMAAFGLSERADTRTAELSKGNRQKVAIARAFLHRPSLLLLDEPTSGLDPEIGRAVRDEIERRRAAGCAVVVSTHNLDEAERLATRVAVLQTTIVALDTPARLRHRLRTGRVLIRVAGDAAAFVPVVRRFDASAAADGDRLAVAPEDADRDTPAVVAALVAAGAAIREVRAEMPRLEDVYLHVVRSADAGGRA